MEHRKVHFVNGFVQVPEDVRKNMEEAHKAPITYTRDCPKLTPKQLAEFKPRSAERLARYGLPPNPEVQKILNQKETPNKTYHR